MNTQNVVDFFGRKKRQEERSHSKPHLRSGGKLLRLMCAEAKPVEAYRLTGIHLKDS